MLTIAQLAPLKNRDPYTYEALTAIVNEVNGLHTQTGSANGAPVSAPPTIAEVEASGGNGDLSVTIKDPAGQAQPNLGLHYFVHWDTNPSFPNPTQEDIGSARGELVRVGTGVTNVYVRVFSQFRNSPNRSPFVYFGTAANPTAVNVSAGASPGAPGGSGGSGGGGGGFGGGGSRSGCVKKGTEIVPLAGEAEIHEEPWSDWVAILLAGGKRLDCVPNHQLYLETAKVAAEAIAPGDFVVTQWGLLEAVEIRRYREAGTKVVVRIPEGKLYWANGFLSHNIKPLLS